MWEGLWYLTWYKHTADESGQRDRDVRKNSMKRRFAKANLNRKNHLLVDKFCHPVTLTIIEVSFLFKKETFVGWGLTFANISGGKFSCLGLGMKME